MASGDRYLLQLNADYLGRPHINNFYFIASGGSAVAADLASAWASTRTSLIQAIVSDEFTFQNVIVLNVDNPADFAFQAYAPATIGGQVSGALPRAVCWTFQYVRATRASNHGWKRISGVTEAMQEDGVAVAGALSDLAAVANAFEQTIAAVGTTFTPVIMRVVYSNTTPPIPTYTEFPISEVAYVYIGSQNTRK